MSEEMTLADIKEKFDSEWVLVGEPELDENLNLVRGKVLFHSKSRDEVRQKDMEIHPRSAAYVYTGPAPDNVLLNI